MASITQTIFLHQVGNMAQDIPQEHLFSTLPPERNNQCSSCLIIPREGLQLAFLEACVTSCGYHDSNILWNVWVEQISKWRQVCLTRRKEGHWAAKMDFHSIIYFPISFSCQISWRHCHAFCIYFVKRHLFGFLFLPFHHCLVKVAVTFICVFDFSLGLLT